MQKGREESMKKTVKDDCIFCKIANGEISSNTIYEDEHFRVIMDINPASKGHCIILPKTHAANLYELPDDWCKEVMPVAKKCAAVLKDVLDYTEDDQFDVVLMNPPYGGSEKTEVKDVLDCEGVNVLQNNGALAGQTVFHLHVHLIPRYQDDTVEIQWKPTQRTDTEELAKKIREAFAD